MCFRWVIGEAEGGNGECIVCKYTVCECIVGMMHIIVTASELASIER